MDLETLCFGNIYSKSNTQHSVLTTVLGGCRPPAQGSTFVTHSQFPSYCNPMRPLKKGLSFFTRFFIIKMKHRNVWNVVPQATISQGLQEAAYGQGPLFPI